MFNLLLTCRYLTAIDVMPYQHHIADNEVFISPFWQNRIRWNPFLNGFSSLLIDNPDEAACQNDPAAAELMSLANDLC